MLIFIWENSNNPKIIENYDYEENFGSLAGLCLENPAFLTGDDCGKFHYYIYVGF